MMLCKAKTKSGEPCKNKAVIGGYCKIHYPDPIPDIPEIVKFNNLAKEYKKTLTHVDKMRNLHESLKFVDPTKEIRETMKHLDTMKGLRASMRFTDQAMAVREATKHLDTMKGLQASMRFADQAMAIGEATKHLDTIKGLRASMGFADQAMAMREATKHLDTMKGLRASMRFADQAMAIREATKHLDTVKGLHESIRHLLPSENFNAALKATNLWNQFGGLKQQIKDLKSTINATSIGSLIEEVRTINAEVGIGEFGIEPVINNDGTLAFSGDSIDLPHLHEAGSQVILHALQSQNENIVQAIQTLINEVRSLKDPLLQKVLSQLIFPFVFAIVFAFFNPVADFYVKGYLNKQEKKQTTLQLNQTVTNSFESKELLNHWRYVTADVLCVRKTKTKSGQLIGYLYFGQVVEILDKRRNWTRVKWSDETGKICIEGWVFTRYLKKFK